MAGARARGFFRACDLLFAARSRRARADLKIKPAKRSYLKAKRFAKKKAKRSNFFSPRRPAIAISGLQRKLAKRKANNPILSHMRDFREIRVFRPDNPKIAIATKTEITNKSQIASIPKIRESFRILQRPQCKEDRRL
jgi:hypothetical protein